MPPDIAAWGAKHLASDSPYKLIGDTLFEQICDEDFAGLYHKEGKPGISPVLLSLVTVFQTLENLTDRDTVKAVLTRIDWKYALHLPFDHDVFNFTVLHDFRKRLITHKAESRVCSSRCCDTAWQHDHQARLHLRSPGSANRCERHGPRQLRLSV